MQDLAQIPNAELRLLGLLGGTFDPVHFGHLRTAEEIKASLSMDEMRLLPCYQPPHRDEPVSDAQDRLRMLQLALSETQGLTVDDREFGREGPSYTIDTLEALREELGNDVAICLVIGMDAFHTLYTWHRWRELMACCHIIVMTRPGWVDWRAQPADARLQALLSVHQADDPAQLRQSAQGIIYCQEVTALDISASKIRQSIAEGHSAGTLTPDSVLQYILQRGLYSPEDKP